MDYPRCSFYKCNDALKEEGCCNCLDWVGVGCLEHIEALKKYKIAKLGEWIKREA